MTIGTPGKQTGSLLQRLAAGEARAAVTFAGQGADVLPGLTAVLDRRPELEDQLDAAAAVLVALAASPAGLASGRFRYGFDVRAWVDDPDAAPPAAYLRSCAVAYPLVLLSQLLAWNDLCALAGGSPPPVVGVAGHSSGVLAALAVASASGPLDGAHVARWLDLAFHTGLHLATAATTVPLTPDAPGPMAAISGIRPTHPVLSLIRSSHASDQRQNDGGAGADGVVIGLVNAPDRVVVSGSPEALGVLRERLAAQAAADERDRAAGRPPEAPLRHRWETLPVDVPYHWPGLQPALDRHMSWLGAADVLPHVADLLVPVLSPADGTDLRERTGLGELGRAVAASQFVEPVRWDRTVAALVAAGADWVLDLGPGVEVARLTGRNLRGLGPRVLPLASPEGLRILATPGASPTGPDLRYADLAPRLLELPDGRRHLDNRYTRATGHPPVVLPGMTPTTADAPIVAAAANAGFSAELAGGGQPAPWIFRERVAELGELLDPGVGVVLNSLYLDRARWAEQVGSGPGAGPGSGEGLLFAAKRAGAPFVGLTVSAGIPEADEAVALLDRLRAAGMVHNAFKPGTVEQIRQVLAIADAAPQHTVVVHIEGGRAGGHHSYEDLDELLLATYADLRVRPNVLVAVGGGVGTPERAAELLTGRWSLRHGEPVMPVDAVLVGTAAMACAEAAASPQVKAALVDLAGSPDWVPRGGTAGGVHSGRSSLNADIHVADNAAARAAALLASVAGDAAAVAARHDEIVEALAATAKPWFGDLRTMTYGAVLDRFTALCAVGRHRRYDDGPWLDPTHRSRARALYSLFATRLSAAATPGSWPPPADPPPPPVVGDGPLPPLAADSSGVVGVGPLPPPAADSSGVVGGGPLPPPAADSSGVVSDGPLPPVDGWPSGVVGDGPLPVVDGPPPPADVPPLAAADSSQLAAGSVGSVAPGASPRTAGGPMPEVDSSSPVGSGSSSSSPAAGSSLPADVDMSASPAGVTVGSKPMPSDAGGTPAVGSGPWDVLDEPGEALAAFRRAFPAADTTLVHPADALAFVEVCDRPGKPVPFVPVIDDQVRRWYMADALWQAQDDRYPADAVFAIPGPAAVAGITEVDEPVAELLGRFERAVVDELEAAGVTPEPRDRLIDGGLAPPPFATLARGRTGPLAALCTTPLVVTDDGRSVANPLWSLVAATDDISTDDRREADQSPAIAGRVGAGRRDDGVDDPVDRLEELVRFEARPIDSSDSVVAETTAPDNVTVTVRMAGDELVLRYERRTGAFHEIDGSSARAGFHRSTLAPGSAPGEWSCPSELTGAYRAATGARHAGVPVDLAFTLAWPTLTALLTEATGPAAPALAGSPAQLAALVHHHHRVRVGPAWPPRPGETGGASARVTEVRNTDTERYVDVTVDLSSPRGPLATVEAGLLVRHPAPAGTPHRHTATHHALDLTPDAAQLDLLLTHESVTPVAPPPHPTAPSSPPPPAASAPLVPGADSPSPSTPDLPPGSAAVPRTSIADDSLPPTAAAPRPPAADAAPLLPGADLPNPSAADSSLGSAAVPRTPGGGDSLAPTAGARGAEAPVVPATDGSVPSVVGGPRTPGVPRTPGAGESLPEGDSPSPSPAAPRTSGADDSLAPTAGARGAEAPVVPATDGSVPSVVDGAGSVGVDVPGSAGADPKVAGTAGAPRGSGADASALVVVAGGPRVGDGVVARGGAVEASVLREDAGLAFAVAAGDRLRVVVATTSSWLSVAGPAHHQARGRILCHRPTTPDPANGAGWVLVGELGLDRVGAEAVNPVDALVEVLGAAGTTRQERPRVELARGQDTAPADMGAFAAVGGDRNPLHRSVLAARWSGLDLPIVHGMWTAARAAAFVVDEVADGDSGRLVDWSVRFTAPVALGAELQFGATRVAVDEGRRRIEVVVRAGEVVVGMGTALVAPPTTALVFPGQGIQRPGLGADDRARSRAARDVWRQADAHTRGHQGWSLLDVVERNPTELRLADGTTIHHPDGVLHCTELTQVALVAQSAAQIAELRAAGALADGDSRSVVAAGHSVGEYGALVALGVLPLEAALDLVHERGRAMQAAVPRDEAGRSPYRMAAVDPSRTGLDAAGLGALVADVAAHTGELAEIVNHNAAGRQYVVTGTVVALAELADRLGASSLRLLDGIDVPFHSTALAAAAGTLRLHLERRIGTVDHRRLVDRWVPNLVGRPFRLDERFVADVEARTGTAVAGPATEDPDDLARRLLVELLAHQVAGPVRWIEVQDALLTPTAAGGLGARRQVEIGPAHASVLTDLARLAPRPPATELLHIHHDRDRVLYADIPTPLPDDDAGPHPDHPGTPSSPASPVPPMSPGDGQLGQDTPSAVPPRQPAAANVPSASGAASTSSAGGTPGVPARHGAHDAPSAAPPHGQAAAQAPAPVGDLSSPSSPGEPLPGVGTSGASPGGWAAASVDVQAEPVWSTGNGGGGRSPLREPVTPAGAQYVPAMAGGAPSGAAAGGDVVPTAGEALAWVLATQARVRLEQLRGDETLDELFQGASSRRNQVLIDLGREFGLSGTDGVLELPLSGLADEIARRAARYRFPGVYLQATIATGLTRARLARRDALDHLATAWGVGPGLAEHVLVTVVMETRPGASARGGPLGQWADDLPATAEDGRRLLDRAVDAIARRRGLDLRPPGTATTTTVDEAAVRRAGERLESALVGAARRLVTGLDRPWPAADGERLDVDHHDSDRARLAILDRELGADRAAEVAGRFDPRRNVCFAGAGGMARWDLVALYHDALARRRAPDELHGEAERLAIHGDDPALAATARWYVGRATALGRPDVADLVAAVTPARRTPLVPERAAELIAALDDGPHAEALRRSLTETPDRTGTVALVTGAAPGSIAAELVRQLLRGGATVVATTSTPTLERRRWWREQYRIAAGPGAVLHVVPANLASFADVDALVDWLADPATPNPHRPDLANPPLVPDLVAPFAATATTGEASDLGAGSETALRVQLVGVERLVARVAGLRGRRHLPGRVTVLLPLSPNHGDFGGDAPYAETKAAIEVLARRARSEPGWGRHARIVGARIGWVRGTGLMRANDALAGPAEQHLGIRTFSADEMGWLLAAAGPPGPPPSAEHAPADLPGHHDAHVWPGRHGDVTPAEHPPADRPRRLDPDPSAEQDPGDLPRPRGNGIAGDDPYVDLDLTGGLAGVPDLRAALTPLVLDLAQQAALDRRSTALIEALDRKLWPDGVPELPQPPPTPTPPAAAESAPAPAPGRPHPEIPAHEMVVIVGTGELGPCGTGATRFAMELDAPLPDEVVVELAWLCGLVRFERQGYRGRWVDAATGTEIPTPGARAETEVAERYRAEVAKRIGLRPLEDDGVVDPAGQEVLTTVHLDTDVTFEVASEQEARSFLAADPAHTEAHRNHRDNHSTWTITRKAGAPTRVPKRIEHTRRVAGQLPTGLDLGRFGIDGDLLVTADRMALVNLACTAEAFRQAGVGPEELLAAVHPAEVANTQGAGMGGMVSIRHLLQDQLLDRERQPDRLQESLGNVVAAHVVQGYVGSYGPMLHPVAACATAGVSLEAAHDLIRSSRAKAVVAGGYDDLTPEGMAGFGDMQATASSDELEALGIEPVESSRANDVRRRGFVESQGGGAFLVVRGDVARELGLPVQGVLVFAGSFGDGLHMSIPAPGMGVLAAATGGPASPLATALRRHGLTTDDIAVVSKHDTSTELNDPNEADLHQRLQDALGRTPGNPLLVVSQKTVTGHAKGGAAAWQVAGVLQTMATGWVPGNRNLDRLDPVIAGHAHLVHGHRALRCAGDDGEPVRAGLVTSLGFGHVSALLALAHPDTFVAALPEAERADYLRRAGERRAEGERRRQEVRHGMAPPIRRTARRLPPTEDPREAEARALLDPAARLHDGPGPAPGAPGRGAGNGPAAGDGPGPGDGARQGTPP